MRCEHGRASTSAPFVLEAQPAALGLGSVDAIETVAKSDNPALAMAALPSAESGA